MQIEKEYIFAPGVPVPSCHASTLTFTPDGTLLAAFFAGAKENADDVEIYLSRRGEDGW